MYRLRSTVLRTNFSVSKCLLKDTPRRLYSTRASTTGYSNAWKYVALSGLVSSVAVGYNMLHPAIALETEVVEAAEIDSIVNEGPSRANGKLSSEVKSVGETVSTEKSSESESEPDADQDQGQAGAYNPETGEINWDCPCLGGMADGPCGEEFKAAFSCFIFSEAEPKGIDCIEKFKGMQECFRKYPEVYSEELRNDEEYGEVPTDAVEVEAENKLVEQIQEAHQTEGSAPVQVDTTSNETVEETAKTN